jgi:hypothetical protein
VERLDDFLAAVANAEQARLTRSLAATFFGAAKICGARNAEPPAASAPLRKLRRGYGYGIRFGVIGFIGWMRMFEKLLPRAVPDAFRGFALSPIT